MRHGTSNGLWDDLGNSAIEFSLVFPVLLVVFMGIVAYGIYFGAVHSTTQLVADAARASVAGLSNQERVAIAQNQVAVDVASYPLLDPAKVTVVAGVLPADSTEFQVTVTYDASSLPIWGLMTFLPLPSQTIVRSATIKQGGY